MEQNQQSKDKSKSNNKKNRLTFQAFRALFLAPSNYGKSYLISDFVLEHLNKGHISPKRVLIFSKTYKSDPSQLKLVQYCKTKCKDFIGNNCREDIDVDELQLLFQSQKFIKETDSKQLKHWLVIFDDCISDDILLQKKTPLKDFYCLGRHYNISTIMSLQAYRSSLNSVCRAQMTIIVIGRLSSQGETEDLLDQYNQGCGDNKKECRKVILNYYDDAIQTHDNHGFLVINTTIQYGQGRLQQNFDNKYYDKQIQKDTGNNQ